MKYKISEKSWIEQNFPELGIYNMSKRTPDGYVCLDKQFVEVKRGSKTLVSSEYKKGGIHYQTQLPYTKYYKGVYLHIKDYKRLLIQKETYPKPMRIIIFDYLDGRIIYDGE